MDAVELPLPAAVAVSKLLTAEGFGRAGVSVEEAEGREADSVSILGNPAINCVSPCSRKDVTCAITDAGQNSVTRHRKAEVGLSRHECQLSSSQDENIFKHCRDVNKCVFLLSKCVGKQSNPKAGKIQRSSSPCSKRQRTEQVEESMSQDGAEDSIVISENCGSGSGHAKEKSQVVKQKHCRDGKRNKAKTKFGSFFSKAGLVSSNSVAGGDNILGIYGLKSDIHDVTKHVDELSLNELLDGSYKCSSFFQDKGKKEANTNENILQSVRKAFPLLQLQRSVQSHNSVKLDCSSNRKTPTWLLSSGACVPTSMDYDKGDNCLTDLASSSKIQDSYNKPGAPANINNSPLYQPKDILERLSFPPAKDLGSLLLDIAKPAITSRSTLDSRSGKLISKRTGLPLFSWSLGGPCKTNIDVGKLSTNKCICQGRWVRIGSIASSLGVFPGCFSDLDSLTYDHSLVPSRGLKLGLSDDKKVSTTVRLPWCEPSSSTATCSPASHVPGAKWNLKYEGNDASLNSPSTNISFREDNYYEKEQSERKIDGHCTDSCSYSPLKSSVGECEELLRHLHMLENSKQVGHSPGLLAAAQTLCEIASHSRKQNQSNGKMRWPKKLSQKAMKARKSRSSTGKVEILSVKTKSVTGSGDLIKVADQMIPSKKPPHFYTINQKKDLSYNDSVGRGLIKWSTPASSRSPPSKLGKDLATDTKLSNSATVKLLSVVPYSTRVLDKAYKSYQKPRKSLTMDWEVGRGKKE